jgi:pyruvate,orthophosphate dikinase
MLGFRGCRLGIGYPEISAMQARAVFEAAAIVPEGRHQGAARDHDSARRLQEGARSADRGRAPAAREVQAEQKVKLNYMVGTMIEIPRGALTADEIAQSAEFFSFGTNDLTQTALGMSRDDSGRSCRSIGARDREEESVRDDRQDGVGSWSRSRWRRAPTQADIKLGICGEHGGDPRRSVLREVGLDYRELLAVSRARARLAAAQAALVVKDAI